MQRSSSGVISGWPAILLAPFLVSVGLLTQLLPRKKTVDRGPEEVAGFIGDFLEGTGGEWDWDAFESLPITDPELDALRQRAARAGPPDPDLAALRVVLGEAEEIARNRAGIVR